MNLIADIGATNSRCALIDNAGRIERSESFTNADFESLETLLKTFLSGARPDRGALAIAAPILGDNVAMLNIDWRFSQHALAETLGIESLKILNDYEALAHSLPRLSPQDCHRIGGGEAVAGSTMAVLGPGSGLGVAAVAPHDNEWTAVAGEGGHVTLAALDETESMIIKDHCHANGHCSAERLLSGPGLVRIYTSLAQRAGRSEDEITPADITAAAAQGDDIATETYDVFFAMLGGVAGDLALTVGARGGVFIAGGIVPRVIEALERSKFRECFVAKGRYRDYLEAIPTAVITAELPAFVGLKSLLGITPG